MDVVEILKALGDETRIRIFNLLRQGPLCVCEMEDILQISQSNASRHLSRLKTADIITAEKQAQWVYFAINADLLARHPFVSILLEQELNTIVKCQHDLSRLKKYKEQGGGCEHIIS
ncbi:metalloregulator ArsR/SmtB family transcription factor [Sporomusa sp.]|uniref:ArsR/SmtB family transcription factor n=1 Tax=Sporomusa sp. TaxID=2078658 RepID=UPI002CE09A15|nr:metalloregulator ArsR/SmtB family transcription factor [Sporomusa sp.]HWR41991.1 metalloregulator ArsR/SmtB family transcription factor [Sporomusa sp.]